MRMRSLVSKNSKDSSAVGIITDWHTLGAVLNIPTHELSWVLHERSTMQHRIILNGRTVYKSDPPLRNIQAKLSMLFEPLLDELPGNDCVLSYRRGLTPVDVLKKFTGSKMMISFDIRKYYDNITLDHIEESLVQCGFTHAGAKLAGRYCLVRRETGRTTLQQGCPASPAISNLVGYFFIDAPIKGWLKREYPELDYRYIRYCDNVTLFLAQDEPEGFRERYNEAVRDILKPYGFKTHDWNSISNNHPKRNQKFLGIILNKEARIERGKIDELRAIMFNMCYLGLSSQSLRYLEKKGAIHQVHETITDDALKVLTRSMRSIMRGHIAYVTQVNEKHGLWLTKLYGASSVIQDRQLRDCEGFRRALCLYKREEPLQTYLDRIRTFIN